MKTKCITDQVLELLPKFIGKISDENLDILNDLDDRDEFVNVLGESILNKIGVEIDDEEFLESIFELVGNYVNCMYGRVL